MQTLLTFFRSLAKAKMVRHSPRCFCGQPASVRLAHSLYFYCPEHARDTTVVYRHWLRRGGESRFGT